MSKNRVVSRSIIRAGLAVACALTFGITPANAQTPKFMPPAPLNSYAAEDNGANEVQVKLATDGNGKWMSLWFNETGIYTAQSSDLGETWSVPTQIGQVMKPKSVMDSSLDYAGNGTWVAQWSVSKFSIWPPAIPEHFVSRSTDSVNWETPERLSNKRDFDSDSDGNGTVITTLGDLLLRSTDAGETWTSSTTNASPADGRIDNVQIAYAGSNKWYHVVAGANYETGTETGLAKLYTSTDGGATWSAPHDAGDWIAPLRAMEAKGNTIVVTNYPGVATSGDGGVTWSNFIHGYASETQQSLVADDAGNWMLAAGEHFSHNIIIVKTTNPLADWALEIYDSRQVVVTEPTHDITPAVAADGSGNFVIAYQSESWESDPGPDFDIKAIHSQDSGTTWTTPVYVNANATDDMPLIEDRYVSMASGDNGTVIAVWGADTDTSHIDWPYLDLDHVMYARSDDYGQTWSVAAPITRPYSNGGSTIDTIPAIVYSGHGRWIAWWGPGNTFGTNAYSISDDNGYTWSNIENLFGYAVDGNDDGILIKVHNAFNGNSGFARLLNGAIYWEEPFLVPGKVLSVTHSSGPNWFAITDDQQTYHSNDNGLTWALAAGTNTPMPHAEIASDKNGGVVALYAIEGEQFSESRLVISRSTDNGLNWSSPMTITNDFVYPWGSTNIPDNWMDIAAAGSDQWVAVYFNSAVQAVISRDGGQTWTAPLRVTPEEDLPFGTREANPNVAAADGKMVIGWEADILEHDSDIYYNFGLFNPHNAAADWQLFE